MACTFRHTSGHRIFPCSEHFPDLIRWKSASGIDLKDFDADDFKYYVKPIDKQATTWEELPDEIRATYDKLGIPEAEKSRLVSGIAAQYESEVIYNSIQKDLEDQGVIFVDTDTAVQKYPEIVKKYFGKCIPSNDNKFSALNTAAWSGGSFVYVPKGVHVDIPLQAYFRINTPNMGQFERTLINWSTIRLTCVRDFSVYDAGIAPDRAFNS